MTTNFYHIGSRYRKKENFLLYLILLREKKFYKKIAKSLEGWGGGGGHQKKLHSDQTNHKIDLANQEISERLVHSYLQWPTKD